jgi:hypothetical protein
VKLIDPRLITQRKYQAFVLRDLETANSINCQLRHIEWLLHRVKPCPAGLMQGGHILAGRPGSDDAQSQRSRTISGHPNRVPDRTFPRGIRRRSVENPPLHRAPSLSALVGRVPIR